MTVMTSRWLGPHITNQTQPKTISILHISTIHPSHLFHILQTILQTILQLSS
jgi:hypothetical protein